MFDLSEIIVDVDSNIAVFGSTVCKFCQEIKYQHVLTLFPVTYFPSLTSDWVS